MPSIMDKAKATLYNCFIISGYSVIHRRGLRGRRREPGVVSLVHKEDNRGHRAVSCSTPPPTELP